MQKGNRMSSSSLTEESRGNWFFLLLSKGYKFPPGMALSLVVLGAYATVLCLGDFHFNWWDIELPLTLHSLLGFVISLLLVFRTNSAYERWWEARKLLGNLNDSGRYVAIKLRALAKFGLDERHRLAEWLCAYVWSIKEHMRDRNHEYSSTLVPPDYRVAYLHSPHKPIFLMYRLADMAKVLHDTGRLDGHELQVVETGLKPVGDLVGGLERIKNTPIPLAYTLHLRRIILLYVVTLPLGLIHDYHWWTVPIVMVTFYIMAGIEYIGEEIEEPFGRDETDLPVSQIAVRICQSISAALEVENPCQPTLMKASVSLKPSDYLPQPTGPN